MAMMTAGPTHGIMATPSPGSESGPPSNEGKARRRGPRTLSGSSKRLPLSDAVSLRFGAASSGESGFQNVSKTAPVRARDSSACASSRESTRRRPRRSRRRSYPAGHARCRADAHLMTALPSPCSWVEHWGIGSVDENLNARLVVSALLVLYRHSS